MILRQRGQPSRKYGLANSTREHFWRQRNSELTLIKFSWLFLCRKLSLQSTLTLSIPPIQQILTQIKFTSRLVLAWAKLLSAICLEWLWLFHSTSKVLFPKLTHTPPSQLASTLKDSSSDLTPTQKICQGSLALVFSTHTL